jgi:lipid-A-disaccharide synthase
VQPGSPAGAIFARPGGEREPAAEISSVARDLTVKFLVSAGEASGEMYGAQLIEALRRKYYVETSAPGRRGERSSLAGAGEKPAEPGSTRTGEAPVATRADQLLFFGVGGDRMRAAGCDTVIDAKDLAVVGITEIISHLPKILGLYKNFIREADRRKPDLAIVIDSPAFNWRVARQMKKRGVPTVYYVAPQFWAWRQGRVRLIRNYIDKALVIFPFEQKFYRDRDVDATFVGHPLAELPCPTISREDYGKDFRLDPAKPWITLMPGSRAKEVRMNLPTMVDAALLLGKDYEYLLPVAPTLDRSFLTREMCRKTSEDLGFARIELPMIHFVPESLPALYHSRAGIIASGTATVEAAMMNTPFVMVYRVSPLTYLLGKPRVKVPRFAMVNLIAGEEVVPELVQRDFTAANVVARVNEILPDGPARTRMLEGLSSVRARLRVRDVDGRHRHPADRAAEIILGLLGRPCQP